MTQASDPAGHFIVFVPGYMGSKLRDKTTGKIVWVDFSAIPLNPLEWDGYVRNLVTTLAYPNSNLEPAGLLDDILFVTPWAKLAEYSRFISMMEDLGFISEGTGHPPGETNLYSFPYDWRQDNRISARQLGQAIEGWSAAHHGAKAWIITHSNGGLVARWYMEKEGGKQQVERLLLIASPWDGTPAAMHMLFNGFDTLFRQQFNLLDIPTRSRDMIRTFPSIYQLIPVQKSILHGTDQQPIDPFTASGWLDDPQQQAYLADGRHFTTELGTELSVPETICFFGRKQLTPTFGEVHMDDTGRWKQIVWHPTEQGDGTLTENSAVHPKAPEKVPFAAGHGDIYVNAALKEILQWELIDKYQADTRAGLVSERLTILFVPDKDVYAPGESITLRASIAENSAGSLPFSAASMRVQVLWRRALPGSTAVAPVGELPHVSLSESAQTPGTFEGRLAAPATEGYYRLVASVRAVGEPTLMLEELIAVEAKPS